MYIRFLVVIFALFSWSASIYAAPVTLNFSGTSLRVLGEFKDGYEVPQNQQEFAPAFQIATSLTTELSFDTQQLDNDSYSYIGKYQLTGLVVTIPDLGFKANGYYNNNPRVTLYEGYQVISGDITVINDVNDAPASEADTLMASTSHIKDDFVSQFSLPVPRTMEVQFSGNASMLADDRLPTAPFNWNSGNISLLFIARDASVRRVVLSFSPAPVNESWGTLNVNSTGAAAVPISNSAGYSGITNYRVQAPSNTVISLVAPVNTQNYRFRDWTGCESISGNYGEICNAKLVPRYVYCFTSPCPQPAIEGTVTANYVPQTSHANPTLYVYSLGAFSVPITSSTGHGSTTNYAIPLTLGTQVSLTAPLTHNGLTFSRWTGCDSNSGSPSANQCSIRMNTAPSDACALSTETNLCTGDRRVTAIYTDPTLRLINLSTRAMVLTDDNILIAGFVISGGAKQLLIKAEGPRLAASRLQNVLQDPTIELFDLTSNRKIAINDNWESNSNASQISASGFAPSYPSESALMLTLNPGAYSVLVRGVNGSTGLALVSINDLDSTSEPNRNYLVGTSAPGRLTNISSRAWVGLGDNQVIAGFIVSGNGQKKFLTQGIGPSMVGVPGLVSDPSITLHDGSLPLSTNTGWTNSPNALTVGLQTNLTARESAVYETLGAGTYTLILRDSNDSTGIGLVSVDE